MAPPAPAHPPIIEQPPAAAPPAPPVLPAAVPAAAQPPRLYVATPCYGCQMTKGYLASLLALQAECMRRGMECMVDFVGNESLVERARNVLAARFVRSSATHLLFVDADIAFQPESVFRLLDSGRDVVTAVYPKKSIDWARVRRALADGSPEPLAQTGLDFNINILGTARTTDGFVKVLDSATGFMMISKPAMQRMYDAYRDELYAVNDIVSPNDTSATAVKDYVALFACMIDPITRRFLSEDYSMCRRWQALGGEIWVDLATPLAHVGTHVFRGGPVV